MILQDFNPATFLGNLHPLNLPRQQLAGKDPVSPGFIYHGESLEFASIQPGCEDNYRYHMMDINPHQQWLPRVRENRKKIKKAPATAGLFPWNRGAEKEKKTTNSSTQELAPT